MIRAAVLSVALAGIALPIGGTAHRRTEEGNRRYEEQAYEDAMRAYTEAQVAAPEAPELHYNLGNVLYRQENWAGAAEEYERAVLSAPPSLAPLATYNLGNARFREGRFEDASKAYRRTLELSPDDAEAKRNLELALRALRAKREPEPPQAGEGQEEKKERREPKEPSSQEEGGGREPAPPPKEKGPEDRRSEGESQSSRMSRAEAKNLLDSVNEQEKANLARRKAERAAADREEREEDW